MQVSPFGGRAATVLVAAARLAFFAGTSALTAATAWVLTYGPTLPLPAPAPVRVGRAPLPPGDYPDGPLRPGAVAPPFQAEGWLNGPPPSPGTSGPRLIVADVWSDW